MRTIKTQEKAKSKVAPLPANKRESRLVELLAFDQKLRAEHKGSLIIGVDEVGRGCLAGPVVAAAVCLPSMKANNPIATGLFELNDSKQLKAAQREKLNLTIREHAVWAIEAASVQEIDELNIAYASLTAMRRAVHQLLDSISASKVLVIVDGHMKIPDLNCRQMVIVKGDGLSAAIAAASVIAKVHRDSYMRGLADSWPMYDWHNNKGYGSKIHRQAIIAHGVSVWHRKAFIARMMAALNQLKIEFE
jgi:ribonuclease HII